VSETPMEKWTQRELLEFHDELTAARTRARTIKEHVYWRGLAPTIVSMSEQPSFEPGFVWDIRRFNGELKLYMSAIEEGRHDLLKPGYHEMAIDAAALRSILASLAGAEVGRWFPATEHMGLDGTTYSLSLASGFSHVELKWWQDGPPEWRDLTTLVRRLITQFKGLDKAPDTLGIDPRRLRVLRRLAFEERRPGVHVSALPMWLVKRRDMRFLLVAQCAGMSEALRQQLLASLTIGSIAEIADIVSRKLPGIPFGAAPVPDDDPSVGADTAFFELDQSSDLFASVWRSGGGMAVVIRAALPPMKIEVWAKRP